MSIRILNGDCRNVLKTLSDQSVHCCVTSPPYFGLRDYDVAGQIGLEPTPEEFVAELVSVFREVRRVLRADGTLWLNLGDSYNAAGRTGHGARIGCKQGSNRASAIGSDSCRPNVKGLKPKDLIGIPWMVAFALRNDGWYLRQDIIWAKPNPMPESVTDRCTKSHEYVFLLSKSERYYYDNEAIKEPAVKGAAGSAFHAGKTGDHQLGRASTKPRTKGKHSGENPQAGGHRMVEAVARASAAGADHDSPFGENRNKRSVWTVSTKSFSEAHFATFPPDLIAPCILAGCPAGGVVLDPFGGAGTTGLVADRLGRDALLIELNPAYTVMIENRIRQDGGLFAQIAE